MQAHNPAYQPVVDAIEGFLEQRTMTRTEFCAAIYGRKPNGGAKGTGGLYEIIKGRQRAGPVVRERIKQALGLELPEVAFASMPMVIAIPTKREDKPKAITPVKAALAAFEQAKPRMVPPPVEPVRKVNGAAHLAPRFALSIAQDGRAQVTMNLMNVSADDALRCLSALGAANLLKPE